VQILFVYDTNNGHTKHNAKKIAKQSYLKTPHRNVNLTVASLSKSLRKSVHRMTLVRLEISQHHTVYRRRINAFSSALVPAISQTERAQNNTQRITRTAKQYFHVIQCFGLKQQKTRRSKYSRPL
jgi:hypothetical protein